MFSKQNISLTVCGHGVSIEMHLCQVSGAGDVRNRAINPERHSSQPKGLIRCSCKQFCRGRSARAEIQTCTVLLCVPAAEAVHMKIRKVILIIVLIIIYLEHIVASRDIWKMYYVML
jgi:hypothetical protein